MAKILRLHIGKDTLSGWDVSEKYGSNVYADAVKGIKDPGINATAKPITSIPSPFAQWDLLKTAFKFVSETKGPNNYPNINQASVYNKLVSNALDVGQLFFEFDKYSDDFEIMMWDAQTSIHQLLQSNDSSHKQLGETLRLYLEQDRIHVDQIYMLNYKKGEKPISIVGATSPTTLFMAVPNDEQLKNLNLHFGNDKAFDDIYAPLYQRDLEYHKYLWALKYNTNNFNSLFPELDAYLDACYVMSDQTRRQELQNGVTQFNHLQNLCVGTNNGMPVQVKGVILKKCYPADDQIRQSDFVIKTTVGKSANLPLVLPNRQFNLPWRYTKDNWNHQTTVPFYDPAPLAQRKLPQVNDQYPYLTVSDFLEDTVLEIPYEFNDEHFWGSKIDGDLEHTYVLPLKPLFFDYFSVNELKQRSMCLLKASANNVSVELKIPTKKGDIVFNRTYYRNCSPSVTDKTNDGAIREVDFSFASLSNIHFQNPSMAMYRFVLASEPEKYDSFGFKLQAYNDQSKTIEVKAEIQRNENDPYRQKSKTFVVQDDNVAFIQIEVGGVKGIIVPNMVCESGNNDFAFAVDFGTTNTHIEYTIGNSKPKPLDITPQDVELQMFTKDNKLSMFDADYLPQFVGNIKSNYRFPLRTALSFCKKTNWNQRVYAFGQSNIPFAYEKSDTPSYNKIETELKWSNEPNNKEKITAYIQNILIILRNKVILNNGSLAQTKLVWFYPVSMSPNRLNQLERIWQDSFRDYFGTNNITCMTESVAPYYYIRGGYGQATTVLVDIGGGSSDVVIASDGDVQAISSFRFAANVLMGTGFHDSKAVPVNPMVKWYFDKFVEQLGTSDDTELGSLKNAAKEIGDRGHSTDMASFLFSLQNDRRVTEIFDNQLNFIDELSNENNRYKIAFLLFISSIIYHIAKMMKAKKYAMPRYVAFSGNGSRIIQVVSLKKNDLSLLAKAIFETVYGTKYNEDGLDIVMQDDPKSITCKGGLITNGNNTNVRALKTVLLYGSTMASNERYGDTDVIVKATVEDVNDFLRVFSQLNKTVKFSDYFGIDAQTLTNTERICKKDIENNIKSGLENKRKEGADDNDNIEETFFFYAITGMIYNLIDQL